MLPEKVPWSLKEVFSVHILRILAGLFLVRAVYPLFFDVSSFWLEITDRLVAIGLVWLFIRRRKRSFSQLGLSLKQLAKNIAWGVSGGILLFFISTWSERMYVSFLLLEPLQHPLIRAAQEAAGWRQLLQPWFLAGVAAPVAEEILYRMFTFLPLRDRYGVFGGALVSAGIFALFHFNPYWLPELLLVGMGLALLYALTGSLVSSIVAHSLVNSTKIIMTYIGLTVI